MFKSSFAKYLTAFVLIIFISFFILSSIITSMVRSHVTSDKEEKLEMTCTVIVNHFAENGYVDLEAHINNSESVKAILSLIPIINLDYNFRFLITDATGEILLSTVNEDKVPETHDGLGRIQIGGIFGNPDRYDDDEFLVHKGSLSGLVGESSLTYGKKIIVEGDIRGYVFGIVSTEDDDRLIKVMRNTVINSSIWIMLAAVIAAYFITERIVNPLRVMTRAAKKFGKGDFSERVEVVGRDEVAELATAFNNMAESLSNLESMRNSFLANVSHDLRTPMTTISGFIDGITSGAIPPEEHNHYLGVISAEVHRLSRLVSQLLDISRLESGDRKFEFTDFDLAELTRLIIISFEQQLEDKQLDVEFDSFEDSVIVNGDKDSIYQVVYNLCHNAIKFSNEKGRFEIKIEKTADKRIRFSVYDDGQTLSDEDVAHIFDRFYKSDKSRGLDKNGVGLGLYICKTIIDAHGQQIGVNVRESGCEFWFTIGDGTYTKVKD